MTTTKKEKLTIFLDASSLKLTPCGLKYIYTVVLGYRGLKMGNDMLFGSAFHKFRSLYRSGVEWGPALKEAVQMFTELSAHGHVKPNKKFLTKGFLSSVCLAYVEKYPIEKDILQPILDDEGKPLVEPATRFAFPFRVMDDMDILVAGTMDSVEHKREEQYNPECNVIVDAKSTGAWKIAQYLSGYRMSSQLMMYRWAIRKYAKFKPNSIWSRLDKSKLGCMIEGIFYSSSEREEGGEDTEGKVKFVRSEKPIFFKDWQLDEFEFMLNGSVDKIVSDVRNLSVNRALPMREGIMTDACETKYGPCPFFEACAAVDDEARESILSRDFKREMYNPLNFG